MDCSPPGSSVHGLLQAGTLGWVASPSSRDLPDPGIDCMSPASHADSLPSEPPGKLSKKKRWNFKMTIFLICSQSWGTHLSSFFTFLICFKCWMTIGWLTLSSSAVSCAVSRDQLRWLLSIGHRQLLVAGHCTLIFRGLISCKSSWITTELSVC